MGYHRSYVVLVLEGLHITGIFNIYLAMLFIILFFQLNLLLSYYMMPTWLNSILYILGGKFCQRRRTKQRMRGGYADNSHLYLFRHHCCMYKVLLLVPIQGNCR